MTLLSAGIAHFLGASLDNRTLSASSLYGYKSDLGTFQRFLGRDMAVEQIRNEQIQAFSRYLTEESGLSLATVKRRVATLKSFIRWLEQEGEVAAGVLRPLDIRLPPPARKKRALFPHARLYRTAN